MALEQEGSEYAEPVDSLGYQLDLCADLLAKVPLDGFVIEHSFIPSVRLTSLLRIVRGARSYNVGIVDQAVKRTLVVTVAIGCQLVCILRESTPLVSLRRAIYGNGCSLDPQEIVDTLPIRRDRDPTAGGLQL